MTVVGPAYGKLNLTLEVVGRRPDGLHDIESVITTIDWHDVVGVTLGLGGGESAAPLGNPPGGGPVMNPPEAGLRLTGPARAGVPDGQGNLALRAARALAELAGCPLDVSIWLEKRLPARSGLGGGSADAAAVLRHGSRLLAEAGVPIADTDLLESARRLGADVTALLAGGACAVSGSGERVARLPLRRLHVVLVVAGESDTAAAYRALLPVELGAEGRATRVREALARGADPAEGDLGSALEGPAGRANPGLAAGLSRLRAAVPQVSWHLTGSGGCAFCLVPSAVVASRLAAGARSVGFPARACRTVGPVEADRFTTWP